MLIGQLLQRLWNVGGAFTCTCNIINRLMSHEYTHSANEYTHLSVWDHDPLWWDSPTKGWPHLPVWSPDCSVCRLCTPIYIVVWHPWAQLKHTLHLWMQATRQSKIGQGWTWECVDRAELIYQPHRPWSGAKMKFIMKGLRTLTEDAGLCGWNLLFLPYLICNLALKLQSLSLSIAISSYSEGNSDTACWQVRVWWHHVSVCHFMVK